MVIYLFPGLGANERVFRFLNITSEYRIIRWIDPCPDETIESYSARISAQIDLNSPSVLLGVSLRGTVAIVVAKHLSLNNLILISSVESHLKLPRALRVLKNRALLKAVMAFYHIRLMRLLSWVFGTKNRHLLRDILLDTKKPFVLWALRESRDSRESDLNFFAFALCAIGTSLLRSIFTSLPSKAGAEIDEFY